MVKKIVEVGQEKGWYGGARSPRIQDERLTPRQLEMIKLRKGMERITKPGSNFLKMPLDTARVLFRPQTLENVRGPHLGWDPLGEGTVKTDVSSWTPVMNREDWAGIYKYHPSSDEKLRRGYETQATPLTPVSEIKGLSPDFGLSPQSETQYGEFSPVEPSSGVMRPWGINFDDLSRKARTRFPQLPGEVDWRENWRMAQMQDVMNNWPHYARMQELQDLGGIPGGLAEAPATDISKQITSNLKKRKGAPRPYLPGRTRMPFEIP